MLDLEWSLAPPACSKIENILTKFAAWEHRKYHWSRHLSDFSTGNTTRKIVRFFALMLFLNWPPHDVHYTYTCWTRRYDWKLSQFLGIRGIEMQTSMGRTCFSENIIIFDTFAVFFADCRRQILLSVNRMLDGSSKTPAGIRKRRKLALAKALEHRSWHTHTIMEPYFCLILTCCGKPFLLHIRDVRNF